MLELVLDVSHARCPLLSVRTGILSPLARQLANGVEPDVLCFASATRCSRVAGDWDTAIRLVTTALQKGLLPNSRTFEARCS